MPPLKSKVWLYFERHVDGGSCKLCRKTMAAKGGITTNLAVHLRKAHKIEITPDPSVAGFFKKNASAETFQAAKQSSSDNSGNFPDLPKLPRLDEMSHSEGPKVSYTDCPKVTDAAGTTVLKTVNQLQSGKQPEWER